MDAQFYGQSSAVFWVNFTGILPSFYSLRSLCFKALLGIISSSFSSRLTACSNNSLHCLLLYHLLFLALARSSTSFLFILALCRFLPTLHQLNYILKMLDQPSLSFVVQLIVHKSRQEQVAFSPVRVYFETSLPFPQSLYGRSDRHCSYGDVITTFSRLHDQPISLNHSASLARFALWTSAKTYQYIRTGHVTWERTCVYWIVNDLNDTEKSCGVLYTVLFQKTLVLKFKCLIRIFDLSPKRKFL